MHLQAPNKSRPQEFYECVRDNIAAAILDLFLNETKKELKMKVGKAQIKKILASADIRTLIRHPEEVYAIEDISQKAQELWVKSFSNPDIPTRDKIAHFKTLLPLMEEFALPYRLAGLAYEMWGDETRLNLKNNIYNLTMVPGIGFIKADAVARSLGQPEYSVNRFKECIVYILKAAYNAGQTHLDRKDLIPLMVKQMKISSSSPLFQSMMEEIEASHTIDDKNPIGNIPNIPRHKKFVIIRGSKYYLTFVLRAEEQIASAIYEMTGSTSLEHCLNYFDEAMRLNPNITPNESQIKAIKSAFTSRISIITGPAGSGKTTIIKIITDIMTLAGLRDGIYLCSPTGKASMRMCEIAGLGAATIHKTIGKHPAGGKPIYNRETPLPNAKLVVVDEVSMIPSILMRDLLYALPDDCHIVLIGDHNQLPSVEAGNVFEALMKNSNVLPVTRLNYIYRQGTTSEIVKLANMVLAGVVPKDLSKYNKEVSWHWAPKDMSKFPGQIIGLYRMLLRSGYTMDEIQILTPLKKGVMGTMAINKIIQDTFNPNRTLSHNGLGIGDRVIHTERSYCCPVTGNVVVNGEVGKVIDIKPGGEIVVEFPDYVSPEQETKTVHYTHHLTEHLQLAYALTIHKYQGSQEKVIIMLVHGKHFFMLSKEILYTGITRAVDKLHIIGNIWGMRHAVNRSEIQQRTSELGNLIRDRFENNPGRCDRVQQPEHGRPDRPISIYTPFWLEGEEQFQTREN